MTKRRVGDFCRLCGETLAEPFPDHIRSCSAGRLRALEDVAAAALVVHARYLRQWTRHQNKAEDRLGRTLARLAARSRGAGGKP